MPNTKVLTKTPRVLTFSRPTDSISLIVHGQGVFLFNAAEACEFFFYDAARSDGLKVSLTATEFSVTRLSNNNRYESQTAVSGGLVSKRGAYYWFSLDSQNQRLSAGVGEPRVETQSYVYQFNPADKLWEANKVFLESLALVVLPAAAVQPLRLLKNPITQVVPMKVKGTETLAMDDVAGTTYLPSAMLSSAGQTLYNCIAGEKFTLNTPDFPDFAEAIEYSIKTPGLWCNTRLKEKATEFDKTPNPLETYLRITLGQNNGESPGVPYVLEIWPVGHYSPVHNHSAANAVIRVLHGKINVSLYPFLCNEAGGVEPFAVTNFEKDDVTWISPTLNQVHKLKNLDTNTETCMTIQCYLYDEADTAHYDYFDYLSNDAAKCQYEPDSDMDFLAFKQKIRSEWIGSSAASAARAAGGAGAMAAVAAVAPRRSMFCC
jgi:hypothetical protein